VTFYHREILDRFFAYRKDKFCSYLLELEEIWRKIVSYCTDLSLIKI
jgi:hypothetical protein